MVGSADIQQAFQTLGINDLPVCVHASLRSFGGLEHGPRTVIDGVLSAGCTLVVPAFTDHYDIAPPPGMRPQRNAWNYDVEGDMPGASRPPYAPSSNLINAGMGALPAAVVDTPGRMRGQHALNSFAALGPRAAEMIAGQQPDDVYAPLRAVAGAGGYALLMGVGLDRLTALHQAELLAGRNLFRRWALDPHGEPHMVHIGSCSNGFPQLDAGLAHLERRITVGDSVWRVYPLQDTINAAAELIRNDPEITRCRPDCRICNDAIAGGPIID